MMEDGLYLFVTITDLGNADEVKRLAHECGSRMNCISRGQGTAHSEMLDVLGLDATDKAVLLSVLSGAGCRDMFRLLRRELRIDLPGNGIAFTININSVGGASTLRFLTGEEA